ncbi:nucleotidyltransferase family protein [Microseira wollei]|uniref:Nucleotidyltransferase family protein n=1 Tax=Microseira wollei NIES-4236 TaxID=2530354 RepID=A0AAV3XNQ3_9CYAN|nr:nucleotidyltransferase family protein [Microseira wollei]GET42097.1 hypothetical protein MiSe_69110 [Microseira wollei NIES-4236]
MNSPNSAQKLLLKAALLQGKLATYSWQQWKASVDIENLDQESYQLLPLLYGNLSAHDVTDDHMGRLKGVYRRSWCENQVMLQNLTTILRCFQEAGIDTLLLKAAALNLNSSQDKALRMINFLDILVHPADALKAMSLLQKLGWQPQGKIPEKLVPFAHVLGFKNPSNQYLNLRWHLFGDGFNQTVEKDFWNWAKLTQVGDASAYILSPTDALFYICVAGGEGNRTMPANRIADAAILLDSSQLEIDWHRLISLAQTYHFVLPLKTTLSQLQDILNYPIPSSSFATIQNLPVSQFEAREYQIVAGKKTPILERFLLRYFQYSRMVNSADYQLKLLGFPRYLQYIWGVERLSQVPYQVIIRGIKRLVSADSLANQRIN